MLRLSLAKHISSCAWQAAAEPALPRLVGTGNIFKEKGYANRTSRTWTDPPSREQDGMECPSALDGRHRVHDRTDRRCSSLLLTSCPKPDPVRGSRAGHSLCRLSGGRRFHSRSHDRRSSSSPPAPRNALKPADGSRRRSELRSRFCPTRTERQWRSRWPDCGRAVGIESATRGPALPEWRTGRPAGGRLCRRRPLIEGSCIPSRKRLLGLSRRR